MFERWCEGTFFSLLCTTCIIFLCNLPDSDKALGMFEKVTSSTSPCPRDFLFSPGAAGWWCMCAKDWNLLYNCECIPSDIWLLVGPAYKCWCYHILLLDSTACRTGLPLDRPSDTGASGTDHAIGPFAWWDTSLRFQRTKNILVTILFSFVSCVQDQNHNPHSHYNAV